MTRKPPARRGILIACILTLLSIALTVDYWAFPYGAPMPGLAENHGENGLWLQRNWAFGEYAPEDIAALPRRLKDNQIRFAYFHVRSIQQDGSLKYHPLDTAKTLTSTLHRTAPGVKIIAWVYVGNKRGVGDVNLGNASVRRKMVDEAVWLVNNCGFDGVQWDYEICSSGDSGFINLLQETRAALPAGKLLSACTALWMPSGFYGWTDAYFAEVAQSCDQVTVMAYDTAAYFPRSYVDVMRKQVVHVSSAVAMANPKCRVLIGIPTYVDGTKSHNPHAENIDFALRGIREGLADPSARPNIVDGVALFADYTTNAADWREYKEGWLK